MGRESLVELDEVNFGQLQASTVERHLGCGNWAELDTILKPHGLSFARYEALVLLTFSSRSSLPLGKMGERLQVHPTSITSIIQRLTRRRPPQSVPAP